MTDDRALELGRKYAPVLETVVEILGSETGTKFGDAFKRACLKHGFSSVPEEVEYSILTSAFVIIGSGRIPGAPDA